ncbi:methyltransferase domain-containing protein [candidate division WOR-3 bacterium]|nr:methyltransferase domain-containing protein [candidate division WOR-3 bacterium]
MKKKHPIDYAKAKVRREILIRQRRDLWTPEQVASLAKHFRLRPGTRMLDAGCGYGYVLRTFGPYCLPRGVLVGLDKEKRLLAGAKRYLRREGLTRVSRLVPGDICALPFGDNEFDVSVAHVVLCHLAKPEKALDELIRVTKPGGCVAVFDNAVSPGSGGGWSTAHRPTMRQRLTDFEAGVRAMAGRKKLGFGDFSVGCFLPGWMEARGMTDVDVRNNERVYWVAPPYRSAGQQTAWRNLNERMKEYRRGFRLDADHVRQMKAGGSSAALVNRVRRYGTESSRRFRKAFRAGTLAFAGSGPFWCVWGFKP